MRFSALYTRAILKGSCRGRGYNFIFAPLSCVITTNIKRLCLCRPPSPQLADILFADIPFRDILFTDILSTDILFMDILSADILFIDILFIN